MANIRKLRFWCYKVLPLVYDNSLSYYELLCKVIDKLNELIDYTVGFTVADPIEWDITSQYPQNTLVVDSNGTAYISLQPVPAGIELGNEDYWVNIFNYGENMEELRSQIAYNTMGGDNVLEAINKDDLIFWKHKIYKALADLPVGTALVENGNVVPYTVDEKINDEIANRISGDNALTILINNEADARGNEDTRIIGLIDDEKDARIAGDEALAELINDNRRDYHVPEDYGAVGDGVTSDTEALRALFADGGNIYIPRSKSYAFWSYISVKSNSNIVIDGTLVAIGPHNEDSLEFFDRVTETPGYTGVHDVKISGTGCIDMQGDILPDSFSTPLRICHCSDIYISGITIKNYSKYHAIEIGGSQNVTIDGVKFLGCFANNTEGNHEAIQIEQSSESGTTYAIPYDGTLTRNVIIKNCVFDESAEGGAVYQSIGSHSRFYDSTWSNYFKDITIKNNIFNKNRITAIGFESNMWNLDIEENIFNENDGDVSIHLNHYMRNCLIKGNVFYYNTNGVIWLGHNDASVNVNDQLDNIEVNGNTIIGYNTSNTANISGIAILGVNNKCSIVNNAFNFITTYSNRPMYLSSTYTSYCYGLVVEGNIINGNFVGRENVVEHYSTQASMEAFLNDRLDKIRSIVYVQGVTGRDDKNVYTVYGARNTYYSVLSIAFYDKLNNRILMLSSPQPTLVQKIIVSEYINGVYSHYQTALTTFSE